MRRMISPSPFTLVIRIRKLSVRLHSSIKHSLRASLVRIEHILVLIHILHLCVNGHHGNIWVVLLISLSLENHTAQVPVI